MSLTFQSLASLPVIASTTGQAVLLVQTTQGFKNIEADSLKDFFTADLAQAVADLEANSGPSIWPTPRKIALTGVLSGEVLLDGSMDVSLPTAIADGALTTAKVLGLPASLTAINTALTGKLGSTANAVSASKLSTLRNINLAGDATGTTTFDGSADASMTVTVAGLTNKVDKTVTLGIGGVGVDYDTILTSGFYRDATSNNTNRPAWTYGQMIVSSGADTAIQLYGSYSGNHLFFRGANYPGGVTTWTPWVEMWHSGNFDPTTKLDAAQRGTANGVATLDGSGKIPSAQLPASFVGQVAYQGTWDASTGNAPTLAPQLGYYYIVTVAGATALDGISDWNVGDWAIYDTQWHKVDNTDAISSWNGRTGAILPAANDYTFAQIASKPTTLLGYGITDAVTTSNYTSADVVSKLAGQTLALSSLSIGADSDILFTESPTNGLNLRAGPSTAYVNYAFGTTGQFKAPTISTGGALVTGPGSPNFNVKSTDAGATGWYMVGVGISWGGNAPVGGLAFYADAVGTAAYFDAAGTMTFNKDVISAGQFTAKGTSPYKFRMVGGNYGAVWYQDGTQMYLLLTNSGDQMGAFNTLRPFYVNVATGGVTMQQGASITNTLTVDKVVCGFDPGVSGSFGCNNWFRSSGQSGIYFNDYGGGVYMQDTTYVRAYNGKAMAASDFVISSDERLKTGIRKLEYKGRLRPVNFVYRKDGKADIGFIAQDVEALYPEAVTTREIDGMKELSIQKMTAVVSHQVNALEDEHAKLVAEVAELRALLTQRKPRLLTFFKRIFS
jgi:hypothetical protein